MRDIDSPAKERRSIRQAIQRIARNCVFLVLLVALPGAALALEAPRNLTVTSTSAMHISLSWDPPPDDGGDPIEAYNVYRCDEGDMPCMLTPDHWIAWVEDGTTFTDTHDDKTAHEEGGSSPIVAGNTYRYAVGAYRDGGGDWSEEVTATADPDGIPPPRSAPEFESDASIGDLVFTVGISIGSLTLPRATGGDVDEDLNKGELSDYSFDPPDLPEGLTFDRFARVMTGTPAIASEKTNYTYWVHDDDSDYSVSDADNLPFTITIQGEVTDPPASPQGLTAQASEAKAALSWTAPTGGAASYILYRGDGDGCANLTLLESALVPDSTYFEDETVTAGATYCYQVSASNAIGEGPPSESAVVTAVTPGAPIGLRVTSASIASIGLAWNPPAADGGGMLDGYNLFRCDESNETCVPEYLAWIPLTDGERYSDDEVTAESTYRYAVGAARLDGQSDWSNEVTAKSTGEPSEIGGSPMVWLFPRADDAVRQGFARVINHSSEGGEVNITAIDDAGMRYGPVALSIDTGQTVHFNSDDLESGNAAKGLPDGVDSGQGDWRLALETTLDLEVLSYIRTEDGFLTAMHDVAPAGPDGLRVVTFNPASNANQVSRLRLINPGNDAAEVTITGVDDAGVSPGEGVQVSVPAGESVTLAADALESGAGLAGSLGDGKGKWRLGVSLGTDVVAMSLLENVGTGHLTNLSTIPPVPEDGVHSVPLFPAASDALGRQGFARVVNRSGEAGAVRIQAYDESDTAYEPLTLSLDAGETAHFNSDDLELGNAGKGLTGSTGAGTGDWRLKLSSELELEVFSYIRTEDGFLTAMHDTAPLVEDVYRVVTLNPGSNVKQVSTLRLINTGTQPASVTVQGIDDAGESPGADIRLTVLGGAVRAYTAANLEASGEGFEGALGDGAGKWRLRLATDEPLIAMSLLASPTGHLTNLSTAPEISSDAQ